MSAGAEKPEKSHHIIISMQVKSQANFVSKQFFNVFCVQSIEILKNLSHIGNIGI